MWICPRLADVGSVHLQNPYIAIFRENPKGCLLLGLKRSENPKDLKIYNEQIQGVQQQNGTDCDIPRGLKP